MASGGKALTRIDFYLTSRDDLGSRDLLVCRIAYKAFKLGYQIHIHSADEEELERLDEKLWTFRDTSFLPHSKCSDAGQAPITLCTEVPPDNRKAHVLVNLNEKIPEGFSSYERVAEVVRAGEMHRRIAREHFRYYRDRGYPLRHHHL